MDSHIFLKLLFYCLFVVAVVIFYIGDMQETLSKEIDKIGEFNFILSLLNEIPIKPTSLHFTVTPLSTYDNYR